MNKILLIHNNYQIKGGEDTNLYEEIKFLEKSNEVEYLLFDNSNKLTISDFISFIIGKNNASDSIILKKLKSFNPDIVYIHNIWFKISFGIFKHLRQKQIKTILKIHNFRYECSRFWLVSNHIKNNSFCFACSNIKHKKQIFNKYFQESYLKSFISILFSKRYFKILKSLNISIAVLSNFHKQELVKSGIDQKKIFIYRNPLSLPLDNRSYNAESNYIVYAGRLNQAKGVEELLQIWNKTSLDDLKLKVVGSGDLKNTLKRKYNQQNIEFCGELDLEDTINEIQNARAIITATKMYEGQPRILTEASYLSVPSIFPAFGGMVEFFPDDYLLKFEQFNYQSLQSKLMYLKDIELMKSLSLSVKSKIDKVLSNTEMKSIFKKMVENDNI